MFSYKSLTTILLGLLCSLQTIDLLAMEHRRGYSLTISKQEFEDLSPLATLLSLEDPLLIIKKGRRYFEMGGEYNTQIARVYFVQAVQQTEDPAVQAQAQLELGFIYLNNRHNENNSEIAHAYFVQAAQQTANPAVQAQAQQNLDLLCFESLSL